MEYYVIYDKDDNLISFCNNLDELSLFTQLRKRQLKYKLKDKNFIYYIHNNSYRKIYKFL
uniref:Uncharacterized protein n=1 Tax=Dulem virus 59 TaxID=3145770 RepID=A0AAU8B6H0_9VIRU